MTTKSIDLKNCECLSEDDKEMFTNIIVDAADRREELYQSRTNPLLKSRDQDLLQSYKLF